MPGGMCFMRDGIILEAAELPAAGKIVDIPHIVRRIQFQMCDHIDPYAHVVVERQHARPQDSHRSMNVALPGYGQFIGMAQAMLWPLTIVQPKDWKAVALRGTARDKIASCAHVSQRYPSVDLHPGRRRKAHDGIADAVCIAEWANSSNP